MGYRRGPLGGAVMTKIPEQMQERQQWVVWRSESRDGKSTKIPYQPNGRKAQSTNPATWSTFAVAASAVNQGYSGVGFVFSVDDPFVGIDLDGCRDPQSG